jgi:putative sterol carrier protein
MRPSIQETYMAHFTSVQEVFEVLPGRVNPETAKGINATIQFDLSGEGGGPWRVDVADGTVTAAPGTAENPSVTVSTSASNYLAIINGEMNAMNAFMLGKVKVKGDMALVMKLQSLFGKS